MPAPVKPIVSATAPTPDPRVGLRPASGTRARPRGTCGSISTTPPGAKVARRDALRPRVHRQVRDSGQLQRLRDVRHLESGEADARADAICARRRRTTSRSTRTCCSCRRRRPTAAPTAASAACPSRSARIACAASASSTSATSQHPKLVTSVQTCRGSHTHTVVTQPGDNDNVYIYVSGTAGVRPADELPGCVGRRARREQLEHRAVPPRSDQGAARAPETGGDRQLAAHLQRSAGAAAQRGARGGDALARTRRAAVRAPAPAQQVRPAARCRRRAGAAAAVRPGRRAADAAMRARRRRPRSESVPRHHGVSGHRPRRRRVRRPRPAARHPRRGAPDPHRLRGRRQHVVLALGDVQQRRHEGPLLRRVGRRIGAALPRDRQDGVGRRRALHDREQQDGVPQLLQDAGGADASSRTASRTTARSIPIPGRDVMVQAWYQGGVSVFDWTDVAHPKEIAFFDRGPIDGTRLVSGGSWSAYWYNGLIVSSEIARGLDIFELLPSGAHLAERDRRGEDGAVRLPERAGPAEVRLAAELRAGARVSSISSSGRGG